MAFLEFLEGIRIPFVTDIMSAITYLGDEIAFLVAALVIFWCVDKKRGYLLLSVGFFGTITSQFMKLVFRIPRPWILREGIAVEGALEGAGGYSFPSGHSQSSVGTFGSIAITTKRRVIRIICIAIAVLVPFSRMYLGVHTPADVLVGSGLAVVFLLALKPLIMGHNGKYIPAVLGTMIVLAIAYLFYVECYPFPVDIDQHNMLSATKNAYTILGALLGFLVVYIVDMKWTHFSEKAVWWAQILKAVLGLAVVLAVKEGLSTPLASLLGEYPGRLVRYFLISVIGGAGWPLTFRWFASLGRKDK